MKHPDSCSCINCQIERAQRPPEDQPRRHRIRRRRNPQWKDDYQARKFWELCVFSGLAKTPELDVLLDHAEIAQSAIMKADAALIAWRERWETPAAPEVPSFSWVGPMPTGKYEYRGNEAVPEAGPAVSPFTSDGNPQVHSPGYCPPEEDDDYRPFDEPEEDDDYRPFDDYRPPVQPPAPCDPVIPHRFIPVTDNRYCGECGGGKLHPIHTQESKS